MSGKSKLVRFVLSFVLFLAINPSAYAGTKHWLPILSGVRDLGGSETGEIAHALVLIKDVYSSNSNEYKTLLRMLHDGKIKVAGGWVSSPSATSGYSLGKVYFSSNVVYPPPIQLMVSRLNDRNRQLAVVTRDQFKAEIWAHRVFLASSLLHEYTHSQQTWVSGRYYADDSELESLLIEDEFLYQIRKTVRTDKLKLVQIDYLIEENASRREQHAH